MRGRMKVHYRAVQPSGEAPRHRPTRWMVPARPCRRESPANRYGIELNHATGFARELGRAPIARLCTPDDYSDDCRESTVRVCAEVDTWASFDRSGPLRAGSYRAPTVCNAATIGSSHKRRWSDRRHQLAYRGAAVRTADGVRGEAQRPLRVRNGFTWTGPVGYYPGVTSPGRVASCGSPLEA